MNTNVSIIDAIRIYERMVSAATTLNMRDLYQEQVDGFKLILKASVYNESITVVFNEEDLKSIGKFADKQEPEQVARWYKEQGHSMATISSELYRLTEQGI